MRHFIFEDSDKYPIAILVKGSAFEQHAIEKVYIKPLTDAGISKADIVVFALEYNANGKAPVKFIKEQLAELLPALESIGSQQIYCADADYFKVLTKSKKLSLI